jgi:hypothetical protein
VSEALTPVLDMIVHQAKQDLPAGEYSALMDELGVVRDTYKVFCPDCDHQWTDHRPLGCGHGWAYGVDGIPTAFGCRCQNRRGGVWGPRPAPVQKGTTVTQSQGQSQEQSLPLGSDGTPDPIPAPENPGTTQDPANSSDADPNKDKYGGGIEGRDPRQ